MKMSENIDQLMTAMSEAQSEMEHASFDSKNPHFKSNYASLASIIDATKPQLTKFGLSLTQWSCSLEDGKVGLTSLLAHKSGQFIMSSMPVNPVKQDPQAFGSAFTYAKRQARTAICGISAEEDDDGNAASQPQNKPQPVFVINKEIANEVSERLNKMNDEASIKDFFKQSMLRLGLNPQSQGYNEWKQLFVDRIASLKESALKEAAA